MFSLPDESLFQESDLTIDLFVFYSYHEYMSTKEKTVLRLRFLGLLDAEEQAIRKYINQQLFSVTSMPRRIIPEQINSRMDFRYDFPSSPTTQVMLEILGLPNTPVVTFYMENISAGGCSVFLQGSNSTGLKKRDVVQIHLTFLDKKLILKAQVM